MHGCDFRRFTLRLPFACRPCSYGDISPGPLSTREVGITILVQVVGTTVFAYVVGNLVAIIVNLNPIAKAKATSLGHLNE